MAATYEPIATLSSSGSTSTFSFTSVPSTYTDIIIVSFLRSSYSISSHDTLIRVNNDASSIYSRTYITGNGSSASSARSSNLTGFYAGQVQGATSTAGAFSTQIVHLMNYSNTSTNKTFISRNNTPTANTTATVGLWRSNSAINQIDILNADGSNWVSGSTSTIYGVKSA
jgi:hypothetical protein